MATSQAVLNSILDGILSSNGLSLEALSKYKDPTILNIVHQLNQLDLVASQICKVCELCSTSAASTAKVVKEDTLAWCKSYANVEQCLNALLATEGVTIVRLWNLPDRDDYHENVLKAFDDQHSRFHEFLGRMDHEHMPRFQRQPTIQRLNKARLAIERLRAFSEWQKISPRPAGQQPQLNRFQVSFPSGQNLRQGYATIFQALVQCLSRCLETARPTSVVSHNQEAPFIDTPTQHQRAASLTSSQLAVSDSGDGASEAQEQDLDISPMSPKAPASIAPTPKLTPVTSQTMKKVYEKMYVQQDCKNPRSSNPSSPARVGHPTSGKLVVKLPDTTPPAFLSATSSSNAIRVAPTPKANSQPKKMTASKWAKPTRDPIYTPSTTTATTSDYATGQKEVHPTSEAHFLRQDLERLRNSFEKERLDLISVITQRNKKIELREKHFQTLAKNDEKQTKEIDALRSKNEALRISLEASESSLKEHSKVLEDMVRAGKAAEDDRNVARHKLELTQQENASLKGQIRDAKEQGRDELRTEISCALIPILHP